MLFLRGKIGFNTLKNICLFICSIIDVYNKKQQVLKKISFLAQEYEVCAQAEAECCQSHESIQFQTRGTRHVFYDCRKY